MKGVDMYISPTNFEWHIKEAIQDWKADKALGKEKSFEFNYLFKRYAFDRRYTVKALAGCGNECSGTVICKVSNNKFKVDFTRDSFNTAFTSFTVERYTEW